MDGYSAGLISNALASLPLLQQMEINLCEGVMPTLSHFKNLRSLSLTSTRNIPRSYWHLEIVPAIAASPSLVSLEILLDKNNNNIAFNEPCYISVQELLASHPPSLRHCNI